MRDRSKSFLDAMRNSVLLLDGAMGTEIQKHMPEPEDFPDGKDGFNDGLVLTRPDWIRQIHRSYLDAGADCVETNSFGSNQIKLDEYGFGDQTLSMNQKIAELASEVCLEYERRDGKMRYVIGSMGPSGFLPSSNDPDLGLRPLDDICDAFEQQARGLVAGGADALLVETSQDILEVKLAIEACHRAMDGTGIRVPIIANATFDQHGKMLLGTDVQAAYTTVSDMHIDLFGMNCSTGPSEMSAGIQWLDEQSEHDILVVPNAGMPENEGGSAVYKMTPEEMGRIMGGFLERHRRVRIVGGCCGTTPEHIAVLRKVIDTTHTAA